MQTYKIDTQYYSLGFPNRNWNELILRENYINQLENDLDLQEMVFIEGDEDSGKTTLCGQFCRKHFANTISIFFNPLSSVDYSIDYFYSCFISQIRHLLGDSIEDIENDNHVTNEKYSYYILQLRRKVKKLKNKFYLVIDGLEEGLSNHSELIKTIFENVPFGQDIFRLIVTGDKNKFIALNSNLKKISHKSITLAGFTSHEINTFLDINDANRRDDIHDLYKITKGFPGRLATLKRLKDNYTLTEILESNTYNNWVQLDCDTIDSTDSVNNVILSILALSNHSLKIDDIEKITGLSKSECELKFKELFVLEVKNQYVTYISAAYKKYFQNILRTTKRKVDDILMKYFANEGTLESRFELSKIYAENKQWPKIIPIIDEKFIVDTLESTGSLTKVTESLELGFKASEHLNKYADIWKYSIQGSIINELDNYLFWESEILARISLKDFSGAIDLAENAVLKVDRLRLLALVARKEKQINNKVNEDLIDLIQSLYNTTDLSSVGDLIYDIVSDLFYAIPNLAIEIIEKSSGQTVDKNINDWIVAKLSIAAISSSDDDDNSLKNKKLNLIENLNNPSVKKIHQSITFLVGNYTAKKVLEEVKKLSDSNERLKLLRLWLNNNKEHSKDLGVVINTAIDELIEGSSYSTMTLEVMKELSYQLAYVSEFDAKKNLLHRFRTLTKDLKDLGLTKDKYVYQLNIFHTEYTLTKEKALGSLKSIINEIDGLEDLLSKIESFCEVYSKLQTINKPLFANQLKFTYSRILSLVEELLLSTANHYKICKNILTTLGKNNPMLGLKICKKLNTMISRDRSRLIVLDAYLDNNLKNVQIKFLIEIEQSFEYVIPQRLCLKHVLERYSEAKSLHHNIIEELFYFTKKIPFLDIHSNKVYAHLLTYRIVAKNEHWKNKISKALKVKIVKDWKDIESDWEKIDVGFTICSEIAKIDNDFAQMIFSETEKLKKDSWLDSESVAETYLNCLNLVIRAYNCLLVSGIDTPNDFKIIGDLLNRIPSEIERLDIWNELCINADHLNNSTITKKIYDVHIFPLVHSIIHKEHNLHSITRSLILVHKYNQEIAIEYLNKLSQLSREEACSIICEFYLSGRSPYEVYDGELTKYDSTASDIIRAISLLKHVDTDAKIFSLINMICDAIINNKTIITRIQTSEIASKLEEIIELKLPDKNNIQHDGYKIVSQIKVELVRRSITPWSEYLNRANNIGNISDRLFTKSIMLGNLPFDKMGDGKSFRANIFDQILDELGKLNSHYEFVDRVIQVSEYMYDVDRTKWKDIVSKAFQISNKFEEGSEMYDYQKKIIDSMYRLDPDYSKTLINMIDNEDKERRNTALLKKYHETLEVANKIKNNLTLEQREKANYGVIIRGIYKAYAALNSGKITVKKISEVSKYLYIGNKLPLKEVIPIYIYYLSNCSKAYRAKKSDNQIGDTLINNFRATIKATELVQILSEKRKINNNIDRKFFIEEDFSANRPINPGTREEAIGFINDWIQEQIEDFVIIIDPYYVKEDIEILKMIKEKDDSIEINILGCNDGQKANIEEDYKAYWKKISDELPPFTNFTFCWVPDDNNNKPIHDRWIISKNGGLRLGTSFNSLGKKKESEISIMKPSESNSIKEQTADYLSKKKREFNNQRLSYKSFTF